jgi:hypothetical protein
MELFLRLFLLKYENKYIILKISYINNSNKIDLLLQTYIVSNNNVSILKLIQDKISENPFDDIFIKKLNIKLHSEKYLNYNNSKINYNILKNQIKENINKIKNNNLNKSDIIIWSICDNNYKFPLDINNILILIKDIETYINSYGLISSINKLISGNNLNILNNNNQENVDLNNNIDNNNIDNKNIFNFIIDPSLKFLLINNILNYYQYINKSEIKKEIKKNNLLFITCPNLININIGYNHNILFSLIISLKNYDNEKLNYIFNKIVDNILINDFEDSNYILCLLFLLFIYSLILSNIHIKDFFIENFENILLDINKQKNIINYFLKKISQNKIILEFKKINIDNIKKISDTDLEQIINKFNYLRKIDEKDFLKNIILNINSKEKEIQDKLNFNYPDDILINNKKIININNLLNNTNNNLLLNYKLDKNNNLTTDIYTELITYSKNKLIITDLLKENDHIKLTIKKFFPLLDNILNINIFPENIINTIDYYKILSENFNDPKIINHIIYLNIIFKIIIPFYYNTYKIDKFIDLLI